jgi:hypothetical protein
LAKRNPSLERFSKAKYKKNERKTPATNETI